MTKILECNFGGKQNKSQFMQCITVSFQGPSSLHIQERKGYIFRFYYLLATAS